MAEKTDNFDYRCSRYLSNCQTCTHYVPAEWLPEENQMEPDSCNRGVKN